MVNNELTCHNKDSCSLSFRNDWWLPCGIAEFIAGLFCRKLFGNTDYQYWVMQVIVVMS